MWFLALITYLVVGWVTPWWSLIVVSAIGGAFCRGFAHAVITGILASSLSWLCLILIWEQRSGYVVARRLGGMFGINNNYLFIGGVVLTAALIGAMSAASGQWTRRLFSE